MNFAQNFSKINKLVFLFGVSPCLLNRQSNKFQCSIYTLIYTVTYLLTLSLVMAFIAFYHYVNGQTFKSTLNIVIFLQHATVMVIFNSMMFDLLIKRRKNVKFLNSLVQLDLNLAKLSRNTDHREEFSSMYKHIVIVVCFNAAFHILTMILDKNSKHLMDYIWDTLQYFQAMSITLVAYYIRSFAIILNQMCLPIFQKFVSIRTDSQNTNGKDELHLLELCTCFEAFDEIMSFKTQLSNVFGIQLLLSTAFDFTVLTILAYGILHFQAKRLLLLCYITILIVFLVFKCVLLVLALDTLANQVLYM